MTGELGNKIDSLWEIFWLMIREPKSKKMIFRILSAALRTSKQISREMDDLEKLLNAK